MRRDNDTRIAYLFLLPALLVFVALIVFPVLFSLALSFTTWDFVSGLKGIKLVGLRNFVWLFESDTFRYALRNTVLYAVTIVPASITLSLVTAYVLNEQVYLKNAIRLAFFVPCIADAVALATVFKSLFKETDGPINLFLKYTLGVQHPPLWLQDSSFSLVPIVTLVVWTSIGYEMIIYMAALQNVPRELYEAADIDGASRFRKFWTVTIPLISPTTFFLVVTRMIAAFKIFTPIKIMTSTTSDRSTTSIVAEVYRQGFSAYRFGFASAEAWVLFVVIFVVTILQMRAQKRWVHYS